MGIKIGIIGGSGLDNLNIFTNARDTFTGTVWGEPDVYKRQVVRGRLFQQAAQPKKRT